MADANCIVDDFDLDFFDQDPAAQDRGMQLRFQQPFVAEIQMEEEPYTGDFRQWIIIFQLFLHPTIKYLLPNRLKDFFMHTTRANQYMQRRGSTESEFPET